MGKIWKKRRKLPGEHAGEKARQQEESEQGALQGMRRLDRRRTFEAQAGRTIFSWSVEAGSKRSIPRAFN
jgi:hypothetical protein